MRAQPKTRPQKRDPQRTRAKILTCATRAFARSGFQGTSLNEILEKAKVNKRMVYHYYGSKEGLYRAVHIHQWQVLAEWFAQELVSAGGPQLATGGSQGLLLKAVEIFHDFCATHQDFIRLLMWDGLEGGKISRSIWSEIRGPLYFRMEELVINAQAQGLIPKNLKPDHFVVSFMGAISFYFGYAHSLGDIFQKDPLKVAAVEERKQQTLALFKKIFQ